jgi:hypothetical protein
LAFSLLLDFPDELLEVSPELLSELPLLEDLDFEEEEEDDSELEPVLPSEPAFDLRGSSPRESVLYQPEPLKEIAGAFSTRVASLPHFSQAWVMGEPKGSRRS